MCRETQSAAPVCGIRPLAEEAGQRDLESEVAIRSRDRERELTIGDVGFLVLVAGMFEIDVYLSVDDDPLCRQNHAAAIGEMCGRPQALMSDEFERPLVAFGDNGLPSGSVAWSCADSRYYRQWQQQAQGQDD